MTPITITIAAGASEDITLADGAIVAFSTNGYLQLVELISDAPVSRWETRKGGSILLPVVAPTWRATNLGTEACVLSAESTASATSGRALVDPLGMPSAAKQLAAGSSSFNTALTSTCRRISMRAVGANIRFSIGTGGQTANADTSHFIAQDERLDFAVPASANIAVIRDAATDGVIELTELA